MSKVYEVEDRFFLARKALDEFLEHDAPDHPEYTALASEYYSARKAFYKELHRSYGWEK